MKSQQTRFPTAEQQLPTLLPLLYIGMPLSEAARDHIFRLIARTARLLKETKKAEGSVG